MSPNETTTMVTTTPSGPFLSHHTRCPDEEDNPTTTAGRHPHLRHINCEVTDDFQWLNSFTDITSQGSHLPLSLTTLHLEVLKTGMRLPLKYLR